ncbi:MAG: 2-amino-4-hydroxy-6-hydroxymethyldihydropteridine diphosphokinase [Minwuia sp.]|uniref:2-amino-4-hydroxy-6- hydroxymethyldihydropteridine diphosphokinase n=1 Tax=Minwuia sp. TaxID=2493630 RepID=UPI003A8820BA
MIIIGLGANLPHPEHGEPAQTLEAALAALASRGVRVAAQSRWYLTPPWPESLSGQPWYVNGVAAVETDLCADRLLQTLHEVEWSFGRVRTERWAPRRIDLDLIDFDGVVRAPCGVHGVAALPHPRMHERAFVLLPLQEIAPDWRHPSSGLPLESMIGGTDCSRIVPMTPEQEKHLAGGAAGS